MEVILTKHADQFNISNAKRIIYLYDEKQINDYLTAGWALLGVGFPTRDGITELCCILGSLLKEDPKTLQEVKFEKLLSSV
jgi:hypothetical protein